MGTAIHSKIVEKIGKIMKRKKLKIYYLVKKMYLHRLIVKKQTDTHQIELSRGKARWHDRNPRYFIIRELGKSKLTC